MNAIENHIELIKKYIQEYSKEDSLEISAEMLFDFFEEKNIKYIKEYINAETIEIALQQLNISYKHIGTTYYCEGEIN